MEGCKHWFAAVGASRAEERLPLFVAAVRDFRSALDLPHEWGRLQTSSLTLPQLVELALLSKRNLFLGATMIDLQVGCLIARWSDVQHVLHPLYI